jgi:futalosine hydrolase
LVVCALPAELRHFRPRADVTLLHAGVGPVEAAAATARALAHDAYDTVVNAGIAGAFRGRAKLGDALLIVEERLADLGLEDGGALTLPDGARLEESVTADARLLARCSALELPRGRGLTVSRVTTTAATAERLAQRYAPDVESMEGFAVLRAAALAGIPAIEVRGISNYVGERSLAEWDFGAGARAASAGLDALLSCLGSAA